MYVLENVPLSSYSTMRLGGPAAFLIEINTRQEIPQALAWAHERKLPIIMIGGGSNIIWRDEGFPGLVVVNKIMRFEVYEEDETNVYLTVGAGENWDNVVSQTVQKGFTGIEQLSHIPGSAGATPIQNVGAYGREIAEVLVTIEAYDTKVNQFVTIPASDCGFEYRSSRFKTTDKGRFYISAITLHLTRGLPTAPFYQSVQDYFAEHRVTSVNPQVLRDAVIAIRKSKLPDPVVVANNGSFFKNPIISQEELVQLSAEHSDLVFWQLPEGKAKLSAAWMVEHAGFKGIHDQSTGMATWQDQPLVVVNEKAEKTASLISFTNKIVEAVQSKFGITLEQEPEILP